MAVCLNALDVTYDFTGQYPEIAECDLEPLASKDFGIMSNAAEPLYDIAPDKRKQIGERILKFYDAHQAKFRQLRTAGQSRSLLDEVYVDWITILHRAVECGANPDRTTAELLSIVKDTNASVSDRAQAAYVLGAYPDNAADTASALIELLTEHDGSLQKTCRVTPYELAGLPDVGTTRNSGTLQIELVGTLGQLGTDAKAAAPCLQDIVSLKWFGTVNVALSQSDLSLVSAAVESLVQIGLTAEAVAAFERLPHSEAARSALRQVPPEKMEQFRKELKSAEGDSNAGPDAGQN